MYACTREYITKKYTNPLAAAAAQQQHKCATLQEMI